MPIRWTRVNDLPDFVGLGSVVVTFTARDDDGNSATCQADVTVEGSASLTLKCGGSQIQISAAGVTISGPMISLG